AEGLIKLQPATIELINNNQVAKGNVLTLASIAGIQAAKQTGFLIPLCHPLNLEKIDVDCQVEANGVRVFSMVKLTGKTGAEMEALNAVNMALLTITTCARLLTNMELTGIKLISKEKYTE
ncbi:MAG: cyclic pyranopterin monophosphate synthase MoaC, partial [Bacteroidales bacterium]|nr:cyclic pyranopterin monophosphate synthase MoaC [Bacteroidales bacterium]